MFHTIPTATVCDSVSWIVEVSKVTNQASVFQFQNCVNSVVGFANSVFFTIYDLTNSVSYRFRYI